MTWLAQRQLWLSAANPAAAPVATTVPPCKALSLRQKLSNLQASDERAALHPRSDRPSGYVPRNTPHAIAHWPAPTASKCVPSCRLPAVALNKRAQGHATEHCAPIAAALSSAGLRRTCRGLHNRRCTVASTRRVVSVPCGACGCHRGACNAPAAPAPEPPRQSGESAMARAQLHYPESPFGPLSGVQCRCHGPHPALQAHDALQCLWRSL